MEQPDYKSRMEQLLQEELHKQASAKAKNSINTKAKSLLVNIIAPTGMLPYTLQKKISDKFAFFKPKLASIASSIYMFALGAYTFGLQSMELEKVSSVNIPGYLSYSATVYDIVIPALLFQTIGAYLMLDAIRAPISYLKRPTGTLIGEALAYIPRAVSKLFKFDDADIAKALSSARSKLYAENILSSINEKNKDLKDLANYTSSLYTTSDPWTKYVLAYKINELRKKMGLEELKQP